MQLLEGSDTRVRFKVQEIEDNIASDLDLDDYDKFLLEIRFSTDKTIEVQGVKDSDTSTITFDIYSEDTDGQEGALSADIWGIAGAKKIRFNPTTIKGKVLNSVTIPNVLQND